MLTYDTKLYSALKTELENTIFTYITVHRQRMQEQLLIIKERCYVSVWLM